MMPFEENGVAVHFPDDNYFFFSECESYKKISNASVKEMDVCWLNINENTLWMVELKAFDHPHNTLFLQQDISNTTIFDYWLNELYLKTIHTLCMLETDRSGTRQCLVEGIEADTAYKVVHLINVAQGQEEYLSFLKDKLQDLLRPYIHLFNVSSINVLPYAMAKKEKWLPWIV